MCRAELGQRRRAANRASNTVVVNGLLDDGQLTGFGHRAPTRIGGLRPIGAPQIGRWPILTAPEGPAIGRWGGVWGGEAPRKK